MHKPGPVYARRCRRRRRSLLPGDVPSGRFRHCRLCANDDKEVVMEAIGGVAILAVILGFLGFWVWSLVDAIRVPDDSAFRAGTKTIWVVVIAVTGLIGSIVYLAMGRPRTA